MGKARVTMLKPRVAMLDTSIAKPLRGAGWRAGKTTNERGYTYAWQEARARFLRSNPLCAYCLKDGRPVAASIVDHIKPHEGDKGLFWDQTNWQSLCKPCHDGVKAREEGRGNRATR